jgi:hypothetical protein
MGPIYIYAVVSDVPGLTRVWSVNVPGTRCVRWAHRLIHIGGQNRSISNMG